MGYFSDSHDSDVFFTVGTQRINSHAVLFLIDDLIYFFGHFVKQIFVQNALEHAFLNKNNMLSIFEKLSANALQTDQITFQVIF